MLLKKTIFIFCSLLALFPTYIQAQSDNYYLLVGTYTRGKSEGIYVYQFNTKTAEFKAVSNTHKVDNPSFLAISPNEKYVYAVGESLEGTVSAFGFDKKSGTLTKINTQSSKGEHPCHLAVDKTGKWLLVGNYTGGSISINPIHADGSLGASSQHIQHIGKGPNTARQEKAHVHSVNIAPNNTDVFVPDLGIDKIMNYQFDAVKGTLTASNPAFNKMADGSGPRHFTFHPNGKLAYAIQELSSTITAFNYKNGKLSPFQTISTLPKEGFKHNFCADIHISPDGKFLYGSNRYVDASNGKTSFAPNLFTDTIAMYSIDAKTGKLTKIGNEPVKGKVPRNFMITPNGEYLLVANQETDNITIFKRNKSTGKLTYVKEIQVPTPVCLKLISKE